MRFLLGWFHGPIFVSSSSVLELISWPGQQIFITGHVGGRDVDQHFAVNTDTYLTLLSEDELERDQPDLLLANRVGNFTLTIPAGGYSSNPNMIHIGHDSVMSHLVQSVMLVPTESTDLYMRAQLVIEPADPAAFCFDRQLVLTDMFVLISGRTTFQAKVSLQTSLGDRISIPSMVDENLMMDDITNFYSLKSADALSYFPPEIRRTIVNYLEQMGFDFRTGATRRQIAFDCRNIFPSLPTIRLDILTHGNHVGTILIAPDDYIQWNMNGYCDIWLNLMDESPNDLSLGRSFFESIAVFFDYRNRQVGFCEPL